MIPSIDKWRPMSTAPRDGSIFMAVFKEYNAKDGQPRVQACQYFCDEKGQDWRWRKPWHTGTTCYADGWLSYEEFAALQPTLDNPEPVKPQAAPEPAPAQDFDL
jgi:hypothetical protein